MGNLVFPSLHFAFFCSGFTHSKATAAVAPKSSKYTSFNSQGQQTKKHLSQSLWGKSQAWVTCLLLQLAPHLNQVNWAGRGETRKGETDAIPAEWKQPLPLLTPQVLLPNTGPPSLLLSCYTMWVMMEIKQAQIGGSRLYTAGLEELSCELFESQLKKKKKSLGNRCHVPCCLSSVQQFGHMRKVDSLFPASLSFIYPKAPEN